MMNAQAAAMFRLRPFAWSAGPFFTLSGEKWESWRRKIQAADLSGKSPLIYV
jgi:hypothetical protein